MLFAHVLEGHALRRIPLAEKEAIPDRAVWLDLVDPTHEEEQRIEQALGVNVPTREEAEEIEVSSRLYREEGALYLTATVIAGSQSEQPESTPVTFLLAGKTLVTVRYAQLNPFEAVVARMSRSLPAGVGDGRDVLLTILDAVVDRIADVLEIVSRSVDAISRYVCATSQRKDLGEVLQRLGRENDLASRVRESLMTLSRLFSYLRAVEREAPADVRAQIGTLSRDVVSLGEHASFISGKLAFLLDATLGQINIEQNAIIKIFSVAAVVFLPPTLIASIYGMNFAHMPELHWLFGYPFALLLMVASAVLTYGFFRQRRWL